MITEKQLQRMEFCKKVLSGQIDTMIINSDKVKNKLTDEVLMSIAYLETFYDYLKEKNFENTADCWKFMNDIKGVIEKIFYVDNYLKRVEQSSIENSKKSS